MYKLSKRRVDTVKEPGFYGDGEGLYLSVKRTGSKSWILRTVVRGKRRDLGIGSTGLVTLAEAREKARELRKIAREGGDPLAYRNSRSLTFQEASIEYHAIIAKSFSSEKHAKLWLSALKIHAFPRIGDQPLEEIGVTDIRMVLEVIWVKKHETARRVKQRMEAIFDWAKAEGHYTHENPCKGVKRALKPQRRNPTHHAALPWNEMPAFYKQLSAREGVSAYALKFIILTACRSGEVREARWDEISEGVWTVPSTRTKMRKPHRVPLSGEALHILGQVRGLDRHLVFPSHVYKSGGVKPLSVNAFRALYKRMGCDGLTTHGFRSTFRDWCSDEAEISREVAEAALGHALGEVERAYRRSDLFERRRSLMIRWSEYADSVN
ncbi:integrase arm-type DNA-binding domain-containing protein [Rhodobacteraceae bacterium KMM 6894]|nr:integrase arm-type DNA-binding domain-containing protein [Rhodobacteraceae bacterium KMM 6894]